MRSLITIFLTMGLVLADNGLQVYQQYASEDNWTPNPNRKSIWDSLLPSPRQGLAGVPPCCILAVGGSAANAAYTTQQAASINSALTSLSERVDSVSSTASSGSTSGSAACSALQTLLAISDPTVATSSGTNTGVGYSSSSTVRSASTDEEVAYYLDQQSSSGSLSGNTYALTSVLYGNGATETAIAAADGLAAISASVLTQLDANVATTITNTALSVHDFNVFRKRVAAAVRTLDDKIREILEVSSPSCS